MKMNKNDPKLTAFVLGELSPSEQALVEQAIKADTELQKEFLLLQKTIGVLSQTQDSEVYRLDPAQREKLFSKVSTWSIWTLGGSLVTATLAFMLYNQTNYEQPTEMAKAPEVVAEAPAQVVVNEKQAPTLKAAAIEEQKEIFKPAAKQQLAKNEIAADAAMDKDMALAGGASGAARSEEGYAAAAKPVAVAAAPQAAQANKLNFEAETSMHSDSMVAARAAFPKKKSAPVETDSKADSELILKLQSCFSENSKHNLTVSFNIQQQTVINLKIEGTGLNDEVKTCITTLVNKQNWDGLKTDYKLKIESK